MVTKAYILICDNTEIAVDKIICGSEIAADEILDMIVDKRYLVKGKALNLSEFPSKKTGVVRLCVELDNKPERYIRREFYIMPNK